MLKQYLKLQIISFILLLSFEVAAKEIKISANSLEVDVKTNFCIFSGNVVVIGENIVIYTSRVIAKFKHENKKNFTITDIIIPNEFMAKRNNGIVINGKSALYNVASNLITLNNAKTEKIE